MTGDRWGVTHDETLRRYACDDFVASPTLRAWRGVRVGASADLVWAWVAQVRLVMRTTRWVAPGLAVGDLIMARRQLLNLKHLAERDQRTATP